MEYFTSALQQYAEFDGRASRRQFWMYFLFYIIFYILVSALGALLGTLILSTIYSLGLLIPSISIAARRLHDTGRSGWWQLLGLIPMIGAIILIVLLALASDGDNEYGPGPKAA